MPTNRIEYNSGQLLGACIYLKDIPNRFKWIRYALFKCVFCEIEFEANIHSVKRGDITSCGCQSSRNKIGEISTTHGIANDTPEYNSWQAMRQRCLNKNNKKYPKYGGAGIKICERWIKSFKDFYEDMGERPIGTTLDRFPNKKGNYEPSNCRWATARQQAQNTSTNVQVWYKGELIDLCELCENMGMNRALVYGRIFRLGKSVEEAVETKRFPNRRLKSSFNFIPHSFGVAHS